MGLAIEIYEAEWYQQNYGFDVVSAVISELGAYNLTSISSAEYEGIPIVIASEELSVLETLAGLTDLPLVQVLLHNQTYDFNDVALYANGVKAEIATILYGENN